MARSKTSIPDFSKFYNVFRGETDRAAAVLGAAYLEASLERLFSSRLLEAAPLTLFAFRGALGDFAGKIDLGFALGWISADSRNDLNIIRNIRNDFAHAVDHTFSFETQSVSDRTKNFRAITLLRTFIEQSVDSLPNIEIREKLKREIFLKMFGTSCGRFETTVANLNIILDKAIKSSVHPDECTDKWEAKLLGEVTLADGETATIDFKKGTVKKT